MKIHRHVVTAALLITPATAWAQIQGPSSSETPFLVPVAPGVATVSILTVGDSPQNTPGYRMVGIPDGLGAYKANANSFRLLMSHELGAALGSVRAHGQTGAFVSEWTIRRSDLRVLSGSDLIQSATIVSGTPAFARFCSADLADRSAFFLFNNGPFNPYLFLNGEESGSEGRAFAHLASGPHKGQSFELPSLGKCSFENVLARPGLSLKTVVASLDDSTPGQVYFYVGAKRFCGNEIERAGLTDGQLFGVRVPGVALEDRTSGINGQTRFELAGLGDVTALTGAALQTASTSAGVTEFLRPEDGTWDPRNPRDFYFVTTDRFDNATQVGRSRLWKLRFDSYHHPEQGGTIQMLLDGTEGQQMMDNLTIDRHGNLLIQEDPGSQDHFASVWHYDVQNDQLTKIAQHDPARFTPGQPGFLTKDEESSGVIDASSILGKGWFLLDVQAHYSIGDAELVENGQLLALYNPASH